MENHHKLSIFEAIKTSFKLILNNFVLFLLSFLATAGIFLLPLLPILIYVSWSLKTLGNKIDVGAAAPYSLMTTISLYCLLFLFLIFIFILGNALYGLLPLRFGHENPRETLLAYISLYLEEEVKAEGLIRNYEPFTRFLQVICLSHGATLNVTNVARECYVKRTTVNDWIAILEDLLISFQIPIFTLRAKRELAAHPKFYFFDAGVYRALRPQSIKDSEAEINGAGLEGLVAQHLIAWRDYSNEKHEINYWRTRSGVEIDFVVFGPLGFWAIEVKNSITVRSEDVKGLVEFCKDHPDAKPILLYRGTDRLIKNNILCMPCDEFLKSVCPDKPLIK